MFKLSLQIHYITFLLFFQKNDEKTGDICYNSQKNKQRCLKMRFSKKQLRIICTVLACAIAVPMILVIFELLG